MVEHVDPSLRLISDACPGATQRFESLGDRHLTSDGEVSVFCVHCISSRQSSRKPFFRHARKLWACWKVATSTRVTSEYLRVCWLSSATRRAHPIRIAPETTDNIRPSEWHNIHHRSSHE